MRFATNANFQNPYIFTNCCRRPLICQTNSVRSNSLNLKHQRFKPSDCKDIGIRKFGFVLLKNSEKKFFIVRRFKLKRSGKT